ncbi:MAG: carbohydrate ABC transporter permease [Clostridiales bacterium]|nr:carbohydrate ABC transporter permease [Clostridiales bacterium]
MSKNSMKDNYKIKDNYNTNLRIRSLIITVICVILAVICLLPIYLLIINATRNTSEILNGATLIPGDQTIINYKKLIALDGFNALTGFKNSFIIAGSSSLLSVFISALTAYALVVYDFKLKGPAFTFILAVLMIPTQVSAIGFVRFMIRLGFFNTYVPLIVPVMAAPATVFFIRQFMKSSFPLDIVEAARIDGSSEFRTFLTIGIPMLKPAMSVQLIFAFIFNWNNFFTPSMIITSTEKYTLPMMINTLSSDRYTDYGMVYMGIALSIVPLIVVYFILSKYIIEGVALGGVKE